MSQSNLQQEKIVQVMNGLQLILTELGGNDIATFDSNLKATMKNIKEISEQFQQQKNLLPSQEQQAGIATTITVEVKRQLLDLDDDFIIEFRKKLGI